MIKVYKKLVYAVALAGVLLTTKTASAMNVPETINLDGGPVGQLTFSAMGYGYFYGQTGTSKKGNGGSILGDKSTGANLSQAFVNIGKSTGVLQFDLEVGATGGTPALGVAPFKPSVNLFTTGPIYAGYITIAPPGSPVTFSAGQLNSIEGYEYGFDHLNANIWTSSVWAVENNNSPGVEATYTQGPVSLIVSYGDGWNTNVWNFVQVLGTYTFHGGSSLSGYYAGNLGRSGLNANTFGECGGVHCTVATYGSNYINSQMFGGYYILPLGNLSLAAEVQYVYAKVDHQVAIDQFTSNFATSFFADYTFGKSPYSLGALANMFTSNGPSYWYLAPHAAGFEAEVTPTWQYKDLFSRVSVGWVHTTHGAVYGNNGTDHNAVQGALEAGILF